MNDDNRHNGLDGPGFQSPTGDFEDEPTPPPRLQQHLEPQSQQFALPDQGGPNRQLGQQPSPGQPGHGNAQPPVQNAPQQGDFNAPATGQFNAPNSGLHSSPPPQQFPQTGNSLGAIGSGQDVSNKMRTTYGAGGFIVGILTGLLLGILNSALEGVSLGDGFGLTLQISGWFGILFGVAFALKPERVEAMLQQWGLKDD